MNASEEFEKRLLAYLDGSLNEQDKKDFEHQLQTTPDLKSKLENLRIMEDLIRLEPLQRPSRNFTQRVMDNLENYPLQNKTSAFNGILLIVGVVVMAGLCTFLLYSGFFDSTQTKIDFNQVMGKYVDQSLPSVSYNSKLLVNVIIILNLILALLVLDRIVLKAVFTRRMQTGT